MVKPVLLDLNLNKQQKTRNQCFFFGNLKMNLLLGPSQNKVQTEVRDLLLEQVNILKKETLVKV